MNAKILLSFCIGLAVGVAGGILGTRSHYKEKYRKEMDEILDEAERYRSGADEYSRTYHEDESDQNVDSVEQQREYMKEEKPEPVAYHKMYKSTKEDSGTDESQEDAEVRRANEFHEKNKGRAPIIISAEAAGDLPVSYEEEPLYYFMGCGTLVDDFDNVIEDPGRLLGDCLTKYGFIDEDNEEDMIFVQNFDLDVCYTVQKVEGCFQDDES